MIKPTKRKAFNFLRSYFDVYNELETVEDKVAFLDAILNKQFLDKDPEGLNFIVNLCYESQRHQIESSVKGWKRASNTNLDGTLLTTPPTPLGTTPPTNPKEEEEKEEEQEKGEVEVKEKVKGKLILERKADFKKSLLPFLEKYDKELLKEFYEYWTQHNEKGKKMRFEYAKYQPFGISYRLATWLKNQNRFKKEKSSAKKEKPIMLADKMKIQYGVK